MAGEAMQDIILETSSVFDGSNPDGERTFVPFAADIVISAGKLFLQGNLPCLASNDTFDPKEDASPPLAHPFGEGDPSSVYSLN